MTSLDPSARIVRGSRRGSRSGVPSEQPHSLPSSPPEPSREQPAPTVPAAPPNNLSSVAWVLLHLCDAGLDLIEFVMDEDNAEELDDVRGSFKNARHNARALYQAGLPK